MALTWPWIVFWLAVIVGFGLLEGYAFKHPEREWTLSRTVAYAGAQWPLSIWLFGVFIGVLAAHFFWPWVATPLGAGGG